MDGGLILPGLRVTSGQRELDHSDPINRGLRGFWPLNEPSGMAFDLSPFRYHLTPVNAPISTIAPRLGRARDFNGTSQSLESSAFKWPAAVPACVSLWVRSPGGTNGVAYDIGSGTFAGTFFACHLPFGTNQAYFYYVTEPTGAVQIDFTPYLNKWVHVVWATNGIDFKGLWIDGRPVYSSTTTAGLIASARTGIAIGRYTSAGGLYHNGGLALVRMMTRVPAQSEVSRLYADPWAGTVAPEERIFVALGRGAAIVSVSLTGIAATASAGSVAYGLGTDATGSGATGSAGSVGPEIGMSASGSAAAAAAGTPTSAIGLAVTGAAMTLSAGALAYTIGFILTGAASAASGGTLAADNGAVTRSLTGIQMSAVPGNVRVTGGTRWQPQAARSETLSAAVLGNTLQPPPRPTGNTDADFRALLQWSNTFYDQFVKARNVLGRIEDHEARLANLEGQE